MAELINNIMDFAHARMGNGITVNLKPTCIQSVLQNVIDDIIIAWPDRIIQSQINVIESITCDPDRVSQLLSNLLANALTHGEPDKPVIINSSIKDGFFELSITNQGKPIPPVLMEKLFLPFTREEKRASQRGLGLGLFIASEIAKAHHATLSVKSDEQETSFILKIPL